jgi:hypothetical protein
MPVTVNVNVPEVDVFGELNVAEPDVDVVPEDVALTTPLQVPVTVAPETATPVLLSTVTVALALKDRLLPAVDIVIADT